MMMRRGQSTLEYALLIGFVVAALIGMQVYVRRALQGKFRDKDAVRESYAPKDTLSAVKVYISMNEKGHSENKVSEANTEMMTNIDRSVSLVSYPEAEAVGFNAEE